MREQLQRLTYKRKLFSEKEIEIIIAACSEKLSIEELSVKFIVSPGATRKYFLNIRRKFERDLCGYMHQLGESKSFDFSLLWKNTRDYKEMKEYIENCQSYETDNYDLDNDSLEEAIARNQ